MAGVKASLQGAAAGEWSNHWPVVVAGAAGATLSSVHIYSTGIVIGALEEQFGWARAQISSGPAIVSVVGLALAPLVGMAVDRYGARRIGLLGAAFFLPAFALAALTSQSIWTWWGVWMLIAFSAAFVSPTVWTAGVSSLFVGRRGLAIALTLCGTGIGAICTPVCANYFFQKYGWQGVYVGLSGLWALVTLPVIWACFSSYLDKQRRIAAVEDNHRIVSLPGLTIREAMMSMKFVQLAAAAVVIALATNGVIVNLVPILRSQGIMASEAAAVAGLIGVGSISGRLVGGYLLDRVNANWVAAVSVVLPVASSVWLLIFPGSVPWACIAVLTMGLAVGIEFDAVAYLMARHFGMRSFGTLFGSITGVIVLVSGLGPLLVNLVYDLSGSYYMALYAFVPACMLSSVLFLSLGSPNTEGFRIERTPISG